MIHDRTFTAVGQNFSPNPREVNFKKLGNCFGKLFWSLKRKLNSTGKILLAAPLMKFFSNLQRPKLQQQWTHPLTRSSFCEQRGKPYDWCDFVINVIVRDECGWAGFDQSVGIKNLRPSYACLDTSVSSPSHRRKALCRLHKGFNSAVNCWCSSDGRFYNATTVISGSAKLVALTSKLNGAAGSKRSRYIYCILSLFFDFNAITMREAVRGFL